MSVTLSSATLSAVSGVSNDLHAICEQVYNEPHTEPQTVGLTSLTQPQRKAILELLKRIDLSNPVQRKNLIVEIKENPRVTRIVHLAITSSDGLGNDYQAFDQALTQSILDKLEVVANIGVSNIRANAIDEWLSQYHSHFDQKTLKVLETKDLYRLTSRLVQCECPNLPAYKALFQNLPEAGKSYAALLKLPISAFWKKTCEVHSGPSQRSYQNRYTALAYYIACKKLSMSRVEKLLTEKELFELMPYLRYGNFEGMQGDTVEKLFASVADLQDLQLQDVTISDLNITQLPALPACQTLYCFNCPQLRALPDVLPLCHTFDCSECAQLQALPVLPACQALYCSNCPQLQELPTLPACQTLRCFSCPRLQALPDVLPLCHTLDCSECPQLQALPALPLCQILDCSKCIRLQALPALPLCRILDCSRCIQLKLLPALFLCETLNCYKCSNLQALPALPLCQTLTCYKCLELRIVPDVLPLCGTLDCSECPQLQALPALPLCRILDCSRCIQLKLLPALPLCQTLTCYKCLDLRIVPDVLPLCSTLDCSECPQLQALPSLPTCQDLDCSDCTQLQALPALPLCQILDCAWCIQLKLLPALFLCETLNCYKCSNLQALPALPLCQILDCSKCIQLQALPALPLCRILDCSRCIQLKLLPALFLCETLNCHKCSNLQALPALPLCQTLTCYKCLELRIVPDVLPLCETLDCSECPQLQALPALPLCQALDCSDCTQLQALLDLPTCQTLDCSRCTQLQTPPTDLPVCLEFWCEECPFLGTRIPRLPQDAQVYTGSGDSMRLEVEINQLDSHPKVVLLELGRNYLLQDKTFPEVYYREDDQENTQEDGGRLLEAIDEGGVRRDLVSRLITSLFDQRRPSADRLSLDLEGFPLLTDPQDIDCFRTLGRILALCYPSDSSFKTGELFPAEFYKKIALTPWSNNIADEDLISNYLHFRELHVISQVADLTVGLSSVDNKALESAAYFLTIDPDENEPRTFFTDPGNRALLRNTIIENARDDKRFSAAALIAQEMKSALGAQAWDQLCSEEKMNEGALLRTRIEGQLSASKLLLQLQYLSQGTVTPLLKEKTSRYLNTWVEKASEEELLQFVRAVTSNNALGKDPINVEIYMRGPEYIPVAHTCSFTIELSGEYPNQETFDKKIKWLLEEGMEKGGFQNA